MQKKKIKQESFIKGILALIFSQILIKLFGLIYKLYLTNKQGFGDTGNAIYSSGFQIYALLLTLSSIVANVVAKFAPAAINFVSVLEIIAINSTSTTVNIVLNSCSIVCELAVAFIVCLPLK